MRHLSLDLRRHYPYRQRTERLIALGRVVLVFFSLIALAIDPTQPSGFALAATIILAGYLVYAVVLAVVAWQVTQPLPGFQVWTYVFDLVVFIAVMYLTEGPTSPFFVFFVFALVVANLRWGSAWAAVAAAAMLCAFVVLGYLGSRVNNFDLIRFIVRAVYLGIIAVLLTQFDRHQEVLRAELDRLARWRRPSAADIPTLLRKALPEAVAILGARRGLLVWDETEEASRFVAYAASANVEFVRMSPDKFGTVVPPVLAPHGFISTAKPMRILLAKDRKLQSMPGDGVDEELRSAFSITDFVTVPLHGGDIDGRLFFLEPPISGAGALFTAEIIASELLAGMEEVKLLAELQRAAAFDERVRTAADLHDGLLQSLTAAGLELATVSATLPPELTETKSKLARLQELVAEERRDLRRLIDEMRPSPAGADRHFDLGSRLAELQKHLQEQWGLQVKVSADGAALGCCSEAGDQFARQVYYLAHEGLTNVARHAHASNAELSLARSDHHLHLRILDDGRGFPVEGRYDMDSLEEIGMGPVALSQRVRSLHGAFFLDTDQTGSRIDIDLPLMTA